MVHCRNFDKMAYASISISISFFFVLLNICTEISQSAVQPGGGPFSNMYSLQPVPGAIQSFSGWPNGRVCNVTMAPYNAQNNSEETQSIQNAIDTCGDLPNGGTVIIPSGFVFVTGSLWLRSNTTLRVSWLSVSVY